MGFEPAVFVAVLALWAIGAIPSRLCNRNLGLVLKLSNAAVVGNLLCALWGCLESWRSTYVPHAFEAVNWQGVSIGFYCDRLSLSMYLLVSFVGLVVVRYAGRYLLGEARQGRFIRWLSFTLAAVCSMVLAANLIVLFIAWVLTSFGLHQLLTHYGDRPNAQRVAFKKFVISRFGDLFLIVAITLIYRACGTVDYAALFRLLEANEALVAGRVELTWAAILLVLGGLTKSAQFPFHTWLPDTMETPTPVSALMHAGVINAGGYLLIRMSLLLEQVPVAMSILVVLGGLTACIGSAIMLTQTNVKRGLAYSTIAQMGMMMLQCGLGAFSTAFLHIVAHSLYKSYAFLSAGTLRARDNQREVLKQPLGTAFGNAASILIVTFAGMLLPFLLLVSFGWLSLTKLPLVFIFALAIQTVMQQIGKQRYSISQICAASLGLGGLFFAMTLFAQWYLKDVLPTPNHPFGVWDWFNSLFVGTMFLLLWSIQFLVQYAPKHTLTRTLYSHMANELYLDLIAHRCVAIFQAKQRSVGQSLVTGKENNV